MPDHICPDIREKPVSASDTARIDCYGQLRGETISSISSLTFPAGITVTGAAISGGVLEVNNRLALAGEVLTFTVSGGTAGTVYKILAVLLTSGGRTIVAGVRIRVVAD